MQLGWRGKVMERAAYLQNQQVCSELGGCECALLYLYKAHTKHNPMRGATAAPSLPVPPSPATLVPGIGYCHYLADTSSFNYSIRDYGTLYLTILHVFRSLQVMELCLSYIS